MKIRSIHFLLVSMLISFASNAITVDKMLIIAEKESESAQIVVNNPSEFPVFLKLTLSEMNSEGQIKPLETNEFEDWPVFIERANYIVEGEGEVTIPIQYLAKKLGKTQSKDRVIALDVMPESTINDGTNGQRMSVLIGYRVWVLISRDDKVIGESQVELKDNAIQLKNNTNTISMIEMDFCETKYNKNIIENCRYSEFLLSGKEKKIDISEFSKGTASFVISDPYKRNVKQINIELE